MKYSIYAVDNNESMRDLYKYTFEPLGYECRTFHSAEELFVALDKNLPNVLLMEVELPKPGMDGIEALKILREQYQTLSIIIVSSRGDEVSKVRGLDSGADDYIVKPCGVLELVARVKVSIRKQNFAKEESTVFEYGDIFLNNDEHIVTVNGNVVKMTLKEFNLLKLLMSKAGNVVPRESILNDVWGFEYYGKTRTLDMHVKSLRSKLSEFSNKEYIQTIRGVGYKFINQ